MLLSAMPAAAQGWHFGGGPLWSVPISRDAGQQRQQVALSIDVTREWESALFGLTLAGTGWPQTASWGSPWDVIALHAAWISPSWGPISFYAGGGFGLMFVAFTKWDAEFPDEYFYHYDSGGAVLLEAGALLFHGAPAGRVSLAAQLLLPTFDVSPQFAPGQTFLPSVFTIGVKVQL